MLRPENVPVSTMSSGLIVVTMRFQKIEHFDFGAHGIVHVPALGMRAFRRGAVIFGLENIAARHDVFYDAVLFFEAVKLAFNTPKQHRAEQDRDNAGGLGIGHAEKRTRIDANDFDEEAGDAGEDQVITENFAFRLSDP